MPAGRHALTWNGTDSAGRRLPSGLYLSQLVADDIETTSKMVLVK
jgi:hypothetical protein